jgi:HK97 family phage portal protein
VKGCYAEIERDGLGKPVALWPIHPSRVTEMRDDSGALFYRVAGTLETQGKQFRAVDVDPADMFHVHGISLDGVVGVSLMKIASESLGIALAAQTMAGSSFGNGHQIGGVLKYPNLIKDEKVKQSLRESWAKIHQGAAKAGNIAIIDGGAEFVKVAITPQEAQSIETREFQVVEVARWLRMPPSKLSAKMGAQGWSSVEGDGIAYVRDCLRPWAVRFEREIDRKLLDGPGELFIRHEFKELTRGDSAGRANYYRTMISTGTLSPNEAREEEGLNPGPAALDQFFMQGAMMPVDKLGQEPAAKPADAPEPQGKPQELPGQPGRPSKEEAAENLIPVFRAAANRVLTREAMAVQRHAGRAGFSAWADDFYADLGNVLANEMHPAAQAFAYAIDGDVADLGQWCAAWSARCKSCAVASAGASLNPDNTPQHLADAVIAFLMEKSHASA